MKHSRLSVLFFVLFLAPWYSVAQTSKGVIAGTVTDVSGAAIADATVTAKDTQGGEVRSVKTGPNGAYRVEAVTPSLYTILITAGGFETVALKDVVVNASVVTSRNAELQVGSVQQTVAVDASATTIQTDNGVLASDISAQEIRALPVNSLNPIDLLVTTPGVTPVANRDNTTNGASFSVNGLRPRGNNFLLDGFDNNDNGVTGQALQPQNLEAVREVVVQTNAYQPEFGRGGASVTNVIYRNGTNEWHGSAWDRYSGAALYAIPAEQKSQGVTVSPQFVENVFGFSLGGPLVKNKLFVFGSSQWDHFNGDSEGNLLTIPTAAGVAALQATNNPNAQLLINSLGGLTAPAASSVVNIGNRGGCGSPCLVPVGTEVRNPKAITRAYEYVVRGDYVASEKNTFSARYIGAYSSASPDLFGNPNALPTQDTSQSGPSRNFGAFWTHVFNAAQVNEVRFTAQNIDFTFGPLGATAANPLYKQPNITIPELPGATYGGLSSTFPQGRGHDTYQFQEAYSYTFGNHNMKVGADIINYQISDVIPFNSRGTVTITAKGNCATIGIATCTGLANFLDNYTGPSGTAGKQFGSPDVSYTQTVQAYYFQDVWKLRPDFTLNYGVRYEYYGTPLNALPYPAVNATAAFDPETLRIPQQPDRNNFGPRVGLAFAPRSQNSILGDNKTVLRAGFGVFYDPLFSNIEDNSAASAPNVLGGTFTAPAAGRGTAGALQLIPAISATLNPRASTTTVLANLVNPLIYQWNFNIERQLPGVLLATISYVGTRGERLFLNQQLNPGVDGVRLNPSRGSIITRGNLGDSSYNGLQIEVSRPFLRHFLFRGSYTFSKAIDNGSDVTTTSGGSSLSQNLFNVGLDRGPSAFDRRHRAVFTWVYDIPSLRFHSALGSVVGYALGNWELAGTAAFQTGAPETIYLGGQDNNRDLTVSNDRPSLGNINAPVNYSAACVSSATCITGVGAVGANGVLTDYNTGAPGTASEFRYIVTLGANGNLGRNTFYNPGRQDWTLAVSRIIKMPFREGHQLEFRAEAFNPFNHPNAGGGTTINGVSGNLNSPIFQNVDVTYEGGRQLRLWLKYRF